LRAAKFLVEYKILTTVEDFMTFKDKSIIKKAYPDIYNVLMAACLAAKYKHEEDELIELKKEILKKYPKKPLAIHHGFSEKQINQVRTGLLFDVGTTFFKNINELVDQRITGKNLIIN
jgi:mRNA-degrading endonuclease HigB of HigAB toxin-antitoxin module